MSKTQDIGADAPQAESADDEAVGSAKSAEKTAPKQVEEIGGPKGPEPTRFGDWSVNGRCIDF